MKKQTRNLLLILTAVLLVLGVSASVALFQDTEQSTGSMFTSDSLDLTVGGENGTISFTFTGTDLYPGITHNAGTVTLTNIGGVAGTVGLQLLNPCSQEGSLLEPELQFGDLPGQEIDPTGYDANCGDGELWDMATLKFYVDLNSDGAFQWYEPVIWGGQHLDMTSYYSIPLGTNLFPANQGFDETLAGGQSFDIGLLVTFKTDAQLASQPQYIGLCNSMAMDDSMTFDLSFTLDQIPPP